LVTGSAHRSEPIEQRSVRADPVSKVSASPAL
jgi:hypothetical protein